MDHRRSIGRSMFDEFAETIAGPSGMQDFERAAQRYATQPWSEHRTYAFCISKLAELVHHATHGAVPLDQAITLALRYTRGGAVSTR